MEFVHLWSFIPTQASSERKPGALDPIGEALDEDGVTLDVADVGGTEVASVDPEVHPTKSVASTAPRHPDIVAP